MVGQYNHFSFMPRCFFSADTKIARQKQRRLSRANDAGQCLEHGAKINLFIAADVSPIILYAGEIRTDLHRLLQFKKLCASPKLSIEPCGDR